MIYHPELQVQIYITCCKELYMSSMKTRYYVLNV